MVMPLLFQMTYKNRLCLDNGNGASVVDIADDVPNVTSLDTLGHVVSFCNCFSNNSLSAIIYLLAHLTKVPGEDRGMDIFGQHCYNMLQHVTN